MPLALVHHGSEAARLAGHVDKLSHVFCAGSTDSGGRLVCNTVMHPLVRCPASLLTVSFVWLFTVLGYVESNGSRWIFGWYMVILDLRVEEHEAGPRGVI